VWAFGPETSGANVLLNDTMEEDTDTDALTAIASSVIQGVFVRERGRR